MAPSTRLYSALMGVCLIFLAATSNAPSQVVIHEMAPNNSGLNFQNASINVILDIYEQDSGKRLVRDANLAGMSPLTINLSGLSKEEALKQISSTLLLNGVALLPVDDHSMKAITVGTNKNPRTEGLPFYTKAADLPVDDQIVSYYMPHSHINPEEAVGIFAQIVPPHSYGIYVPAPSAHSVVLTENVSIIRRLIDLQKLIDVPDNTPRSPPPPHSPQHAGFGMNDMILLVIVNFIAVAVGSFCGNIWFRRKAVSAP